MSAAQRNTRAKQWLGIVLLVIVGVVCARLGLWQVHRAAESRTIIASFAAAESAAPLTALPEHASQAVRYRRVRLQGHYVPRRQFLVDNIVRQSRVGYYVLTPFEPDHGRRWVIVNRGWVPAGMDRSVRPDVRVDADERTIVGRLANLPAPGLRLGKPAPDNANDPLPVLSYPSMADLEGRVGRELFGYQLQLDADLPDGFERMWSAPVVMSPARHWGYVGQWWAFAALSFGIAVALVLREAGWRKR